MRVVAAIVAILFLYWSDATSPAPLAVRCSASLEWGDQTIFKRITITLPEELDQHLFASDSDMQDITALGNAPGFGRVYVVGLGKLEILEALGSAQETQRYDFVVTRLPSDDNALVGFYMIGTYVNLIRADLYKPERPFVFFDTYNNEILRGKCDQ